MFFVDGLQLVEITVKNMSYKHRINLIEAVLGTTYFNTSQYLRNVV